MRFAACLIRGFVGRPYAFVRFSFVIVPCFRLFDFHISSRREGEHPVELASDLIVLDTIPKVRPMTVLTVLRFEWDLDC